MRRLALVALPTLLLALSGSATAASPRGACVKPRIGFLGPLTGPAAFVGKEQVGHARLAVRRIGGARLLELDTALDPARARRAAGTLHANRDVLAVVGPAGSQEVLAAAPVLTRREWLAFVSASALDAGLTNGSIPTFFRVVPSDRAQAPAVVRLLRSTLKAARVAIVDDGTTYSRALADRVQTRLRARGVAVARSRIDPSRTGFAAAAARVAPATDAVFLPFHVAATAQVFGEELRRQGRTATIVGSDTLDSRDFTLPGSYVASFAPRVRIAGYAGPVTKFGAPAYVAAEVVARAIRAACADGRASRREVVDRVRATDLPRTALGGRLRFTPRGDVRGASYTFVRLGR